MTVPSLALETVQLTAGEVKYIYKISDQGDLALNTTTIHFETGSDDEQGQQVRRFHEFDRY